MIITTYKLIDNPIKLKILNKNLYLSVFKKRKSIEGRFILEKNKNSRMCNGECVSSHFLRLLCGLLAKLRRSIKGWAATRQAVKGMAQMMYFCLTRIQSKVPLSWKSFTKTNLLGAKPTVSCSNLRDASMPFYYLVYSMMRLLASACEDTFRVSSSLPSNLKLTMKISALLKV